MGRLITVVAVATNDMAITSKRLQDIEKLKNEFRQHWKISDLGELTWYLACAETEMREL